MVSSGVAPTLTNHNITVALEKVMLRLAILKVVLWHRLCYKNPEVHLLIFFKWIVSQ